MDSGMITKQDLENKYIFWDIDGTLAAYRFNGHVADPNGTDNGIIEYCKKEAIDLKEVIYVDDVIKFLREAERKGIESWHISSFLDWQFYNK